MTRKCNGRHYCSSCVSWYYYYSFSSRIFKSEKKRVFLSCFTAWYFAVYAGYIITAWQLYFFIFTCSYYFNSDLFDFYCVNCRKHFDWIVIGYSQIKASKDLLSFDLRWVFISSCNGIYTFCIEELWCIIIASCSYMKYKLKSSGSRFFPLSEDYYFNTFLFC